jgi:hypothetical protein
LFDRSSPNTRDYESANEHKIQGIATPKVLEYFQTKAIPKLHALIGND